MFDIKLDNVTNMKVKIIKYGISENFEKIDIKYQFLTFTLMLYNFFIFFNFVQHLLFILLSQLLLKRIKKKRLKRLIIQK